MSPVRARDDVLPGSSMSVCTPADTYSLTSSNAPVAVAMKKSRRTGLNGSATAPDSFLSILCSKCLSPSRVPSSFLINPCFNCAHV